MSVRSKGATKLSTRRPRARRMEPDERRKLLVACAVRVAAKNGLAGVRHSDVAREAKVSNATAYVYFPTHEDLIDAILDYVEGTLLGLAETILSTPLPPVSPQRSNAGRRRAVIPATFRPKTVRGCGSERPIWLLR